MKLGANPALQFVDGFTALHTAARVRQSNILGMLLAAYSAKSPLLLEPFVNFKDKSGRTSLHYACRSGRSETVALLLNTGADPRIIDFMHMSSLDECLECEEE